MQIKVLGSAAAEGWPALFCECDICKYAWEHKGKDVRRRTSYLLNDDVMIDYGPDVYGQSLQFDIDLFSSRIPMTTIAIPWSSHGAAKASPSSRKTSTSTPTRRRSTASSSGS